MSDSVIAKLDDSVWKLFDEAENSDPSRAKRKTAASGKDGDAGKNAVHTERPEVD